MLKNGRVAMPNNANADNPYAPPATSYDCYGMVRRTFQVGRDEIHTICVESSLWWGLRTHTIDAAGNPTPAQRGTCRFQVGKREQHHFEVQVDEAGRVNVLVDGELVEHNLFPRVQAVIIALVVALFVAMVVVSVIVVLALTIGSSFASKLFND